jgi:hypothetical protein
MLAFFERICDENGYDAEPFYESWNSKDNQKQLATLTKPTKTTKEKKAKDPNKPKRGKSAYIFFCTEEREAVKRDMPEAKATEVTTELGIRWSALKEATKSKDKKRIEKYTQQALEDKTRYDEEMSGYQPPSDEELMKNSRKKSKSKKDPNAPKRGKSAYIFFCSAKRAEVKEDLGDEAKATEITSRLGELWNELKESVESEDVEELESYNRMAANDKDRYLTEMSNYVPNEDESDEPAKAAPKAKGGKKKKDVESSDDESDELTKAAHKAKGGKKKKDAESSDDEGPSKQKPSKTTKKSTKKSSEGKSSVKKVSGYTYFCSQNRTDVKENHPDWQAADVTKELSNMWKELDEEEKKEWREAAAAEAENTE